MMYMMTIDIRTRARRVKNYGFIVFDAKSKTQVTKVL